jgi:acyl-CoA synthetase (AMP-forming)/AMP-acid ligase II
MPLGQGHTSFGRYADGVGANGYQLLPAAPTAFGGINHLTSATVRMTGGHERLATTEGSPRQMGRGVAQAVTVAALAAGETGELWSRSPLMFSGYWRRPEAEARAVRAGWVSAGDLARRDEEGYLYLVDRKDDMIISGGENVYPRESEEVLLRHPAVQEVAVIGMPHEYWGDAITAFVHLRAGMDADEKALQEFCGRQLARWKVP